MRSCFLSIKSIAITTKRQNPLLKRQAVGKLVQSYTAEEIADQSNPFRI